MGLSLRQVITKRYMKSDLYPFFNDDIVEIAKIPNDGTTYHIATVGLKGTTNLIIKVGQVYKVTRVYVNGTDIELEDMTTKDRFEYKSANLIMASKAHQTIYS